jgi:glycosyltransferase involved in cell wall biosynthesis
MRLGIDASNLLAGGGRTHLIELLCAADPQAHGFSDVVVWGSHDTLKTLPARPWILKHHHGALEGGVLRRLIWQYFVLPRLSRAASVDVLFAPGGNASTGFRPVVTMCRNMLPFQPTEAARYGFSRMRLRVEALRFTQQHAFRNADAVIFLSQFALEQTTRITGPIRGSVFMIPHGVSDRFFVNSKQHRAHAPSADVPARVLYVSSIDSYKHQWLVVQAVSNIRNRGFPVVLEIIGSSYGPARKLLDEAVRTHDPYSQWVTVRGVVPHTELSAVYQEADIAVFASTCENFPNILLEKMAAGLPIVCSRCRPMSDILGKSGVYFDAGHVDELERGLIKLIELPELRRRLGNDAQDLARKYSWKACADATFSALRTVAEHSQSA